MLDFGLPTNLVGGRFFIPDKLSGSWFWKFCPTWAELFFWIFSWNASKNAFLVGYHWERFFLKSLTKTPLPPATTWESFSKSFPKPVDNSPLNVLTSKGIFFWSRWKSLFEIPNIVRDIQKLDGQVMYLYNGGTAVIRYMNKWIPMFHHRSVLSDTVSAHRKCRTAPPRLWFCWREQEESRTRLWIFRADYIEHHFEARATLPPILGALCNRLFLFFLHSTTEWPSEWDMFSGEVMPRYERTKENETLGWDSRAGTTFG